MQQRLSLVTLGVADPDGHLWEVVHNPFWASFATRWGRALGSYAKPKELPVRLDAFGSTNSSSFD